MSDADVVRLRTGDLEFRFSDLAIRLDAGDSEALAAKALELLGWNNGFETGLRVGDHEALVMDDVHIRDQIEKIRASGTRTPAVPVTRQRLASPWSEGSALEPREVKGPPARRFSKQQAAPPAAVVTKKVVVTKRGPESVPEGVIDAVLFADPAEQLRYEVRHFYLCTVPENERGDWPIVRFTILDQFMTDLSGLRGEMSRQQVLSAIADVVSGMVTKINSRKVRVLRQGGGDSGRPVVTREDGSVAYRANAQNGTAAARRIMWWKLPDNSIELARFAVHDDLAMPAR